MACRIFTLLSIGLLVPLWGWSNSFDHLTVEDGLASNHVYNIHQDHLGFMWSGTTRGLVRWDGTSCRVFRHHPDDSTLLSFDEVRCIYEDSLRNLWIGTANGLNRLNLATERITRYYFRDDVAGSKTLFDILPETDSTLWIATTGGLVFFNCRTGEHERFVYRDEKNVVVWQRIVLL